MDGRPEAVLDLIPDLIVTMEPDGTIVSVNAAVARVLDWPADELVGRSGFDFVHPDERDEALERIAAQIDEGSSTRRHHLNVARRGGGFNKFEMLAVTSAETGGRFVLVLRDVSEREEAQRRLHRSDEQLRALTENVPDALGRFDAASHLEFATRSFHAIEEEHPDLVAAWRRTASEVADSGEPAQLEHRLAGGRRWLETRFVPEFDPQGEVTHVLVIATDLTAHKELELRLAREATHDDLTGLFNRQRFRELAERSLGARQAQEGRRQRSQPGAVVAVLFVDLDGFKAVNDEHGHPAGDTVLHTVAQRLSRVVRPHDVVARFGGDEFVVLCPGLSHVGGAHVVADRILAALREPITVEDLTVTVGASIGIAVGTAGAADVDELLEQADRAMYAAKAEGGGTALSVDA